MLSTGAFPYAFYRCADQRNEAENLGVQYGQRNTSLTWLHAQAGASTS